MHRAVLLGQQNVWTWEFLDQGEPVLDLRHENGSEAVYVATDLAASFGNYSYRDIKRTVFKQQCNSPPYVNPALSGCRIVDVPAVDVQQRSLDY